LQASIAHRSLVAGDDDLPGRIEVDRLHHLTLRRLFACGAHLFVAEVEDRRHRALAFRHRFLHRLRAEPDQRQAIAEGERLGRDQRRVLAKAVAGHHFRPRPAQRAPGAICRIAGGHHRRLRIHREVERLAGPFVEQFDEIAAQCLAGAVAHLVSARQPRIHLQHADRLRTLPRKYHRQFHRPTSSRESRPR
jgi:hypothetical protein